MGVNLVRGNPHQSDDKVMLSSAPIKVEAIDSVTVAREYAWDPEHMTEEERSNPLGGNIRKLSEDHDIIVEVTGKNRCAIIVR